MVIIRTAIAVIFLGLALTTNGCMEKVFWVISTLWIVNEFKRKQENKLKYTKRMGGILSGYLLLILLLYFFQYKIEPMKAGARYTDTNSKALILVLEEEALVYDLPVAIKKYIQNNSVLANLKLPFQLFSYKVAHEKNSFGKKYYINSQISYKLKAALSHEYSIYVARVANEPFLEEVFQQVMQTKKESLIIVPIMLTENPSFSRIYDEINRLNRSQYRVKTKTIAPLWDSDLVAQSFINQIEKEIPMQNQYNVGIILVGDENKRGEEDQLYKKQDLLFREKMRDLLILQGYSENRVRLVPLNPREIKKELEKLMEYGVGRIAIVTVSSSAQEINNVQKMKRAIKGVDLPYAVEIQLVNPWNHEELLIQEIMRRIQLTSLQNWN